jgi:hypothetical protein
MESKCNFNIRPTGFFLGQAEPPVGRICKIRSAVVLIKLQPYHQGALNVIRLFYFRHRKTLQRLRILGGLI